MPDVSLLFQNAQQCADSRIAGGGGQGGLHFGGGGAPVAMQNIHDLALAAAEMRFDRHDKYAKKFNTSPKAVKSKVLKF